MQSHALPGHHSTCLSVLHHPVIGVSPFEQVTVPATKGQIVHLLGTSEGHDLFTCFAEELGYRLDNALLFCHVPMAGLDSFSQSLPCTCS